jgi:V/A-type H+-transporting ATPase subunit K
MKRILVLGLVLVLLGLAVTAPPSFGAIVMAEGQAGGGQVEVEFGRALARLGAAIAIAVACFGAAWGLSTTSAAAIGAIAERPELFGRTVIYVVFVEAIAIYALVVALLILMTA